MPTSQFTIYTSSDREGPGLVNGITGSLIEILDACLVNGYGTGSYFKQAAGWSKPFPNVSASVGSDPSLACYKQASGSKFTLFVNDSGPGAAIGKETRIVGWETITELTGSGNQGLRYTGSNGVGSGYGQFPLPSQQLTNGFVVWRKSATTDTVGRPWVVAADNRTVYLWILSGDVTNGYMHGGFGDIFSLAGSNDRYNCFIAGRMIENSGVFGSVDWTGRIAQGGGYSNNNFIQLSSLDTAMPGHYLARTFAGTGGSIGFTKKGEPINNSIDNNIPRSVAMSGLLQTPNGTDNSYYIVPLQVIEPTSVVMRGRLRGLYQPCHPFGSFNDGQTITGGGDYFGKTFTVIRLTSSADGVWLLETSPTVETN